MVGRCQKQGRQVKANKRTEGIPVLFVTSMDEVEDETMGLEMGAIDYVTKPVSTPILRVRVGNHLELKRYQYQLENQVNIRTKKLKEGYADTIFRLIMASECKDEDTGIQFRKITPIPKPWPRR